MIVVPLACGAGMGLACWLAIRAVAPRPVGLRAALADLHRLPATNEMQHADDWRARFGRRIANAAQMAGFLNDRVQGDLDVVGRTVEQHAVQKCVASVVCGALPLTMYVVLAVGGVAASPPLFVLAALSGGLFGFVVPDLTLRTEAQRRRREFRHALGAYLDLVTVILAGGGGTESALTDAAAAGDGWAMARLRRALASCRLTGSTPWDAFDRLGQELGVDELRELAATVGLAGEQGAKVRQSLAAKAMSLREHETAAVEAEAQSATERMALPLVMLLFSFVVFIGYPAIARVLTDF
ncbi:MAG: type II secretion system F family protein [Acidimicrobiia bacterium]